MNYQEQFSDNCPSSIAKLNTICMYMYKFVSVYYWQEAGLLKFIVFKFTFVSLSLDIFLILQTS